MKFRTKNSLYFPLIKELGLEVNIYSEKHRPIGTTDAVCAHELEKLLEKGVRVYGGKYCLGGEWSFVSHNNATHDHTALLIGIKPIVRDTAEGLLREITQHSMSVLPSDFLERAKRLLGEK